VVSVANLYSKVTIVLSWFGVTKATKVAVFTVKLLAGLTETTALSRGSSGLHESKRKEVIRNTAIKPFCKVILFINKTLNGF
jgi:hypothetical protein